jgi:hypothetical protein
MLTHHYTAQLLAEERIKDALAQAEKDRMIREIKFSNRPRRRQAAALIKRLRTILTGRRVEKQCQTLPTAVEHGAALECAS